MQWLSHGLLFFGSSTLSGCSAISSSSSAEAHAVATLQIITFRMEAYMACCANHYLNCASVRKQVKLYALIASQHTSKSHQRRYYFSVEAHAIAALRGIIL